MTVANDTIYVATYDGRLDALDARTGAQRWELQTFGPVELAPVVAGGTVYVRSLSATPQPLGGSIYALDARTGALRWQSLLAGETVADLAVANGVVYTSSTDGLLAFDAATGAERWRFAPGTPQSAQGDVGSPVVSNGAVYVTAFNVVFALNA